MVRGLYIGASSMKAQEYNMDRVANNLANVDVTGFKKDISIMKSFPELLISRSHDKNVTVFPIGSVDSGAIVGKLGLGVEHNESFTSFEQGSLKETSNPFDFALANNKNSKATGFFTVETPMGERYSRNGSFVLGKEGYLTTKEGYRVLGENGPIRIKANNFNVDEMGNISVNARYDANDPRELVGQNGNQWEETIVLDRLKVVHFYDEMGNGSERYLAKQGSSMWKATELSGEAEVLEIDNKDRPQVLQNFLEASSVNAVNEMVTMITVNRAYEASQKTVQAADSSIEQVLNKVLRNN